MKLPNKQSGIFRLLALLTGLFVFSELLFLALKMHVTGLDAAIYNEAKSQVVHLGSNLQIFNYSLLLLFLWFVLAQVLVYVGLILFLWYVTTSICKMFSLGTKAATFLAFTVWLAFVSAILCANAYYSPHSFFAVLIRRDLASHFVTDNQIYQALLISSAFCALLLALTLCAVAYDLYRRTDLKKHICMIAMLTLIVTATCWDKLFYFPAITSAATADKPNIFIIGFDAVRPDYLSYFNGHGKVTPNFDKFLKSSFVFTDAYTPLARTFPSWVSILTGKSPLHTNAREDNIDLTSLKLDRTLAMQLKRAGYTTVYLSDDNRFNNINNGIFGFEQVYGPGGNFADFIINGCNDFPLSNLFVATRLGKFLFPISHANHASPHTYNPNEFIYTVDEALKRSNTRPIFLAAHFNVTAWPFYFFNDKVNSDASLPNYKNMITAGDKQFGQFLTLLEKHGMLDHAIFVLLSDHGITLNLPGDKVISENLYQGNKKNIKVNRNQYANVMLGYDGQKLSYDKDEVKFISIGNKTLFNDPEKAADTLSNAMSMMNPALYGIDTSWGYGNDVLSLKQYHHLLAFRAYNVNFGAPRNITGRASNLDIMPTILDLLNIPTETKLDGISLKQYLMGEQNNLSDRRSILLESCFSNAEFDQAEGATTKAVKENISSFQLDPVSGYMSFKKSEVTALVKRKQRAILWGDWLLAYYPSSQRYTLREGKLVAYVFPPYTVLINLKSGKWTTDLKSRFSKTAPLDFLTSQLHEYYGKEMEYYN